MTKYTVQFEMPCEDPVNNVSMTRGKKVMHFFVPLNHPLAHNLGLVQLLEALERRALSTLSTPLNNTGSSDRYLVVLKRAREKAEAEADLVAALAVDGEAAKGGAEADPGA